MEDKFVPLKMKKILFIFIFGILLLGVVSAVPQFNFHDKELRKQLRETDVIEEEGGTWINKRYFTYNASEKELLIEKKNNKLILDMKLITPYENKVGTGNDTMIAEFLVIDYHKQASKVFDIVWTFDVNDNYTYGEQDLWFKYGLDYEIEDCIEIGENETECYNYTQTNWTYFEDFKALSKIEGCEENVKVGLFTNTETGEKKEWVPTIEGFDIFQWAEYDVTAGSPFEFDATLAQHNSLVKINDTHYLNTYMGQDLDGYAVVLIVNGTTITKGTAYEFDTNDGTYNSLIKINDTHYLNTYAGSGSDGYAVVLMVDGTTITKGTAYEFDTNDGTYNSLIKINDTHYLNTYTGSGSDGYAVVLIVDGTTITKGTAYEFDNSRGEYNSLVRVNETHYLNVYRGDSYQGNAVVLMIDGTTITKGTTYIFDTAYGAEHSIIKIDETHYINAYYNGKGITTILKLTGNTISKENSFEFYSTSTFDNSLIQISENQYINTFSGSGSDGYAIIFEVEINETEINDSCTYTSGDWNITMSDYCILDTNTDIGANDIIFFGIGNCTINSKIEVANMIPPTTGGTVYIDSNAEIIIG